MTIKKRQEADEADETRRISGLIGVNIPPEKTSKSDLKDLERAKMGAISIFLNLSAW